MTVWYQCCTFFFQHTHTVGNFHITHSHPYQGSAEQPGHSHTATQFLTIGLLSLFAALVLTAAFAAVALPAAIRLVRRSRPYGLRQWCTPAVALRGPPAPA